MESHPGGCLLPLQTEGIQPQIHKLGAKEERIVLVVVFWKSKVMRWTVVVAALWQRLLLFQSRGGFPGKGMPQKLDQFGVVFQIVCDIRTVRTGPRLNGQYATVLVTAVAATGGRCREGGSIGSSLDTAICGRSRCTIVVTKTIALIRTIDLRCWKGSNRKNGKKS